MPIYERIINKKKTYDVVVNKRVNGRQVNRRRRGISSKAKAERVHIELLVEVSQLKDKPNRHTWNNWAEACLKKMRLQFLNSTVIGYKSHFDKWVNPVIGELFLDEVTSDIIHDLIFTKLDSLSLCSRKDILKHIKRVLEMAVEDNLISRNPAKGIKVKVPEAEQLVFNRTEINLLLTEAFKQKNSWANHWALALMTGMRNGELYALNWTDVDFENRVITVSKSWTVKNGLGSTKSCKNRFIPISSELMTFLKRLKAKSKDKNGYVLERISEWNWGDQARVLKEFCLKIGITPIKFHDLRATFITQLLIKGVPLAKVMKIVGHATIKTTMRYLRLVAQDVHGATDALELSIPNSDDFENVIPMFA
jgi:integrase